MTRQPVCPPDHALAAQVQHVPAHHTHAEQAQVHHVGRPAVHVGRHVKTRSDSVRQGANPLPGGPMPPKCMPNA